MTIYTDYELEDDRKVANLGEPTTVLQPEEAELLQRTREAAANMSRILQGLDMGNLGEEKVTAVPEIAGLVNKVVGITPVDDLMQQVEQNAARLADPTIPLPSHPRIDDLSDTDKRSFLIELNQLIGEMLQLLSKLSDRDRTKNDHMKKEYDGLNDRVGVAIQKSANTQFYVTAFALALNIVGGVTGNDGVSKFMQFLGQQSNPIGNLVSAGYEVEKSKSSNKLTLLSTKMQETATKSGDNSGWRNELLQSLNDTKNLWSSSVSNR